MKCKNNLKLSLFFKLGVLLSTPSFSSSYESLVEELNTLEKTPLSEVMKERNAQLVRIDQIQGEISKKLIKEYFQKNANLKNKLDQFQNLSEKSKKGIESLLTLDLVNESLRRLVDLDLTSLKPLLKKINFDLFQSSLPVLNIFGHTHDESPIEMKAGFHRGEKSILLNLEKIHPKEWDLVFIHELIHAVDDTLFSATKIYSEEETVKELFSYQEKGITKWQDLSGTQKEKMDRWIRAGLDRGLLAEYRAWVLSAIIYQEAREKSKTEALSYMEEMIHSHPETRDLKMKVFLFLDGRSTDPTDGIFKNPLFQDSLKTYRQALRQSPTAPHLGEFQRLFNN